MPASWFTLVHIVVCCYLMMKMMMIIIFIIFYCYSINRCWILLVPSAFCWEVRMFSWRCMSSDLEAVSLWHYFRKHCNHKFSSLVWPFMSHVYFSYTFLISNGILFREKITSCSRLWTQSNLKSYKEFTQKWSEYLNLRMEFLCVKSPAQDQLNKVRINEDSNWSVALCIFKSADFTFPQYPHQT